MKEKRVAQLVNYHSANSNAVTTREVEPITFPDDCKMVLAFEACIVVSTQIVEVSLDRA